MGSRKSFSTLNSSILITLRFHPGCPTTPSLWSQRRNSSLNIQGCLAPPPRPPIWCTTRIHSKATRFLPFPSREHYFCLAPEFQRRLPAGYTHEDVVEGIADRASRGRRIEQRPHHKPFNEESRLVMGLS